MSSYTSHAPGADTCHAHAHRLGIHELKRIWLGVGRAGNGGASVLAVVLRLRITANEPSLDIQRSVGLKRLLAKRKVRQRDKS